jgi:hypothetical protein
MLAVWPDYHEYALKVLMFSVLNNQTVTSVNYLENWNLVSLPMVVTDATYSSIYPDAISGTLYGFFGTYVSETVLENGQGYWLFFEEEGSTDVTGNPIDQVTIFLTEGWNLMGSLSSAFESSSIDDPEEIIISGSIYGFGGSYQPTSTLQPGKGYWINASADGQVTLNSGGTARIKPFIDRTADANVIRFNGVPLYFGVTMPENELQSYEIPPKPPTGAFDVRFADNMKVAENSSTIEIMNNSDQLMITYNIKDDADWILAGNEEYRLSGSGETVVNGDIAGFTLNKVPGVPLTYSVSQNYPNPFNPLTSISYEIPKESFVTISVYNLLGQKVADLVSNLHQAGYHNVMWNSMEMSGKPLSSGVYIYTIQADDFRAVKKMALLK